MATRSISNAYPVFVDDDAETTVHDRAVVEAAEALGPRAPETCSVVAAAVIDIGAASPSDAPVSLHVVVQGDATQDGEEPGVGDRPTVPSAEMAPAAGSCVLRAIDSGRARVRDSLESGRACIRDSIASSLSTSSAAVARDLPPTNMNVTPAAMAIPIVPAPDRTSRRGRGASASRRGPSRVAAVLAGLSLVLTIVVSAFVLVHRTGDLRVAVNVQRGATPTAEVFVDGLLRCDATPCVVHDLTPGDHAVVVRAPGYLTPDPEIERVAAGRERLSMVTLRPASGGVRAASLQTGVRLVVDGVDRGPLPIELDNLSPGSHQVRFDGGGELVASEQTVSVRPGEVKNLGPVHLARRPRPEPALRAQ